MNTTKKTAAVIVAHPDDETLWAGGTILMNPDMNWFIVTLTRKSDKDRSVKFFKAIEYLGATGIMGDLDDGPEQIPLNMKDLKQSMLYLLPGNSYDLILTHHPFGEYTRHVRHEETSRAVIELWNEGLLSTKELWLFAYEDGGRKYLPRAMKTKAESIMLSEKIWYDKYYIIREIYGFDQNSWEAKTTPVEESFIKTGNVSEAMLLMENKMAEK